MPTAAPIDCFATRIARAGRAVDQGEWASGHAMLTGLYECGLRHGCRDGEACAAAAELMLEDVRCMVGDQIGARLSQP